MSVSLTTGSYIRSPLARTVYRKIMEDQIDSNSDHSYWYRVDKRKLSPELCNHFVQFHDDFETKQFIADCRDKSDWLFTELFHSLAKFFLSWVMHQTSINGLLRRGSMFVFSRDQFQQFMNIDDNWKAHRMIDLGAGDGVVTKQMSPYFSEVHVTETSPTMIWRLKERNYTVVDIDTWHSNKSTQYDLISALNLLDRCSRPRSILRQIRSSLIPVTGRALIAVVLPFSPYVEFNGGGVGNEPEEGIAVEGQTFEEHASSLVRNAFIPAGFTVERFTRVPYLCEGDLHHAYYILYDALFLLRPTEEKDLQPSDFIASFSATEEETW